MGTNYYVRYPACPHCGRRDEDRHIGKSSAGWKFSLRVYPEEGVNNLEDWRREWEKGEIINEYDEPVAVEKLLQSILERSHPRGLLSLAEHNDERPYGPMAQYGGPTYDLCDYEFS